MEQDFRRIEFSTRILKRKLDLVNSHIDGKMDFYEDLFGFINQIYDDKLLKRIFEEIRVDDSEYLKKHVKRSFIHVNRIGDEIKRLLSNFDKDTLNDKEIHSLSSNIMGSAGVVVSVNYRIHLIKEVVEEIRNRLLFLNKPELAKDFSLILRKPTHDLGMPKNVPNKYSYFVGSELSNLFNEYFIELQIFQDNQKGESFVIERLNKELNFFWNRGIKESSDPRFQDFLYRLGEKSTTDDLTIESNKYFLIYRVVCNRIYDRLMNGLDSYFEHNDKNKKTLKIDSNNTIYNKTKNYSWEDIKIKIDNRVEFSVWLLENSKETFLGKVGHQSIGCYKKTKDKKPDNQWNTLLRFSVSGSYLNPKPSESEKIRKQIEVLNKRFQGFFGIKEKPFKSKNGKYSTLFLLEPEPILRGDGSEWGIKDEESEYLSNYE